MTWGDDPESRLARGVFVALIYLAVAVVILTALRVGGVL